MPLICNSQYIRETESAVKYYFAQVLGRIFLLAGVFFNSWFGWRVLVVGVITKLGIAPVHFWFPSVLSGLTWDMCLVLITVQKIPLFIMLSYLERKIMVSVVIVRGLSVVLGGVMGMNQRHLRPLLGYSSIRHSGWMVGVIMVSKGVIWFYFMVYCIIVLGLVKVLKKVEGVVFAWSSLWGYCILYLLSLGGLPPLRGFGIKMAVILCLRSKSVVLVIIMVIGSLFRLYYYLKLRFCILCWDVILKVSREINIRVVDSCLLIVRSRLFFCFIFLCLRFFVEE